MRVHFTCPCDYRTAVDSRNVAAFVTHAVSGPELSTAVHASTPGASTVAVPHPVARAGVLSKRTLVLASHAVERAALASADLDDAIVLAMFQRLPYFRREHAVYEQIARTARTTVIGMVDDTRPDLPHGVTPVFLRPEEPLAREWSVVVLSAEFGATVVAHDLQDVNPAESSLEAARLFQGRWGLRRDEAYAEAVRLRDALGDRLPPSARNRVEQVLSTVVNPPSAELERRVEAALTHTVGQLERRGCELARLRVSRQDDRRDQRDPWTGLHTLDSAYRWLGTSAAGTLPLGLTLARVDELAGLAEHHDARLAMQVENHVADLLRAHLRPIDRAVRLSLTEFLVVQPALSQDGLSAHSARISADLAALHARYPFIGAVPAVCTLRTTERPLPLDLMRGTLNRNWPPRTGSLAEAMA